MTRILGVLRMIGRAVLWPIRLVREGEADLDGTYPDRRRPSPEELAARHGVITSLTGLGQG